MTNNWYNVKVTFRMGESREIVSHIGSVDDIIIFRKVNLAVFRELMSKISILVPTKIQFDQKALI